MTDRPARRVALVWALACALGSSAWLVTAAARVGVTFDEPVYLATGLDRWRHDGIGGLMRLGTMPLAVDLVTLPVAVAERVRGTPYRLASDGDGRLVDGADLHRVLPLARAGTLVFWWILLAAAWRLAVRAAGPLAGALAVTWLACEPSLLAHGALATTDIAVTALLLAFAATLPTGALPARGGWIVPGMWFGLALLAKASAVAFAPLIAAAWALGRGVTRWADEARFFARTSALALAVAIVYCGSDWRTEESFVVWARTLPPGPAASVMVTVAERLPIFSNAGEGIVRQIGHNVRGHDTYVLGRAHRRAVWFYFPVAASIKTSSAVLMGLLAMAILDRRALMNRLLGAAVLVLAASPAFRVQTGVRIMLPVLALAIAGLAAAVAHAIATSDARRHIAALMLAGLITTSSAVTAWRAWPDAIVYVNGLWGGSSRAPWLVSDSNYDWGQGLPSLRAALGADDRRIDVWYWGTDPAARQAPFRLLDIRALAPMDEAALQQWMAGRTLAVGATLLDGSVLSPDARVADVDRTAAATAEALRGMLRRRAAARIGPFFVYQF